MTIEERALEKYPVVTNISLAIDYGKDANYMYRTGYIEGATDQDPISKAEQKKIDIEKATIALNKMLISLDFDDEWATTLIKEFKQAMEE